MRHLVLLLAVAVVMPLEAVAQTQQPDVAWEATGAMLTGRYYHSATLLPSGRVLVAGGTSNDHAAGGFDSAEIHDSAALRFSRVGGRLATPRYAHAAALLPTGNVLLAGGLRGVGDYRVALASAELYDPGPMAFSATGPLAASRAVFTATLLPSGDVLVTGGHDGTAALASTELYDPGAETFSATGSLATAREGHTATLLASGKVLVVGGFDGAVNLASAELYDPAAGSFAATGPLATGRHGHSATLLHSGEVIVVGGAGGSGSAELYDPVAGTFSPTGAPAIARDGHTATLLPSGEVLVAAGLATASAELYDQASGTFVATGSLRSWRRWHTATLLPSGGVLVAGGAALLVNEQGISGVALASAELCPSAQGAGCRVCGGDGTCAVLSPDSGCGAYEPRAGDDSGCSCFAAGALDHTGGGGAWLVVATALAAAAARGRGGCDAPPGAIRQPRRAAPRVVNDPCLAKGGTGERAEPPEREVSDGTVESPVGPRSCRGVYQRRGPDEPARRALR